MEFKDIQPFVRFVRYIKIEENSYFPTCIPLDCRIFYTVKGAGIVSIGDKNLYINDGSLLYINSGIKYTLLPCNVTFLAINFDFTNKNYSLSTPIPPVNAEETPEYKILENINFSDTVCFNSHFVFEDCQSLLENLTRLEKEFTRKLPFYKQETCALLTSILTKLARFSEQRSSKDSRFNIEKVVSYIQNHYNKPLSNSLLAEIFHYHPNYLSTEFKRCLGTSLHRYVLETRIFKACSLIESGYENLNEIASLCGFSDTNYFIRYFKKIIGISPAKFARASKNILT